MPAKKKPKSKSALHRERVAKKAQIRAATIARAVELSQQGWLVTRIAEDLGTTQKTVSKWLKAHGIDSRYAPRDPEKRKAEAEAKAKAEASELLFADEHLARSLGKEEERKALAEVAENQASPADQYQAFIAAQGVLLMRDSLPNVRGPRTIKELSELDQIIRRNMGLSPRGGQGAAAGITIDISVLNNPRAAKGAVGVTVEAQEVDEDEDYGEDE